MNFKRLPFSNCPRFHSAPQFPSEKTSERPRFCSNGNHEEVKS